MISYHLKHNIYRYFSSTGIPRIPSGDQDGAEETQTQGDTELMAHWPKEDAGTRKTTVEPEGRWNLEKPKRWIAEVPPEARNPKMEPGRRLTKAELEGRGSVLSGASVGGTPFYTRKIPLKAKVYLTCAVSTFTSRMRCCTCTIREVSKNCLHVDGVRGCPRAILMMKIM